MQKKDFLEFVVISDAHIKNRLWTNNCLVQGDSYEALKKIKSTFKEDNKILLSAGDLFDTPRPSSKDVSEVADFISSFREVIYVDGNHDKADPSWLSSLGDRVIHASVKPAMISSNVAVFGVDYTHSKESLFEQLTEIGNNSSVRFKVVLMHQALKEFIGIEGTYMCSAEDVLNLVGPNCVVFCGDIHKTDVVKSQTTNSIVVSPGSLVPQNITQAKLAHYWHTFTDKDVFDITKHDLGVRTYIQVTTVDELMWTVKSPVSITHSTLPDVIYCVFDHGVVIPKFTDEQLKGRILIVTYKNQNNTVDITVDNAPEVYTIEQAVFDDLDQTQKKPEKYKALAKVLLDSDDPLQSLESILTKLKAIRSQEC